MSGEGGCLSRWQDRNSIWSYHKCYLKHSVSRSQNLHFSIHKMARKTFHVILWEVCFLQNWWLLEKRGFPFASATQPLNQKTTQFPDHKISISAFTRCSDTVIWDKNGDRKWLEIDLVLNQKLLGKIKICPMNASIEVLWLVLHRSYQRDWKQCDGVSTLHIFAFLHIRK